jgi:dephospho-CoA kinase
MNLDNQKLRAIQTSKTHLKKELEKETRPEIREKIQHYIDELNREETRILNEKYRLGDPIQ